MSVTAKGEEMSLLEIHAARAKRQKEDRRFMAMCIALGLIVGLLCAIFLVLVARQ